MQGFVCCHSSIRGENIAVAVVRRQNRSSEEKKIVTVNSNEE